MIIVSAFIISPYLFPKISQEPKEIEQEDIISYELKKSITKLSPILNVTVLDKDGNLKAQQIKEDDLIMANFLQFFTALLWDSNGATRTTTMYDNGGTLRTIYIYGDEVTFFNEFFTVDAGGYIGIGNGTTAPTRSDYSLESIQESIVVPSTPGYLSGLVAISASWSVTSNYSVSEVAFFEKWISSTDPYYFMIMRDTFTPISVVEGDQVFCSYNIWLNNTGFTDNFGKFLAGIFQNTQTDKTMSFTDVTGVNRTFYVYSDHLTAKNAQLNYATDSRIYFAMGENDTVGRTQYQLGAMIGSYVGASQPTHNNTAVILSASQTMPGTYDIDTAGLFVQWADTGSTPRIIMFWKLNFTAVSVYDGYTMTVAFRLLT